MCNCSSRRTRELPARRVKGLCSQICRNTYSRTACKVPTLISCCLSRFICRARSSFTASCCEAPHSHAKTVRSLRLRQYHNFHCCMAGDCRFSLATHDRRQELVSPLREQNCRHAVFSENLAVPISCDPIGNRAHRLDPDLGTDSRTNDRDYYCD